jgi:hypothetical protein
VGTAVPAKTISTSGGGSKTVATGEGTAVAMAVGATDCGDPQPNKSSVREKYMIRAWKYFLSVKRLKNG